MGQKVNPHGLRVGVIKDWDSRWYAKKADFGDMLVEDYNIRNYILKTLKPGSTEYNKVNDQIINISRMKQNEVKTDDKTIHYYLPVSYPTGCHDCLYSRCNECQYKRESTTK